ncbi:MAG: protein kinase [Acidobacteriota bacterium]
MATATKQRSGLSLATRIFLVTAVLVALSVGAAVVITSLIGNRIAGEAVRSALSSSHAQQAAAQLQRYDQLKLASRLITGDAQFRAYVAQAGAANDTASILDQLKERQGDLPFNFAIVLDPDGKTWARSDRPTAKAGQDLAQRPLVAEAIRKQGGESVAGVWEDADEGTKLFEAVATPLTQDYILQGFLVTGFAIDDKRAQEVRRSSGTEVVYLAASPSGPEVVASTLVPELTRELVPALRAQGGALHDAMEETRVVPQIELQLGGSPWVALLSPLLDAAGKSAGVSVTLASLDKAAASYKRIEQVLLLGGLISVLLAAALSYLMAQRTMAPVRQLAAAAETASQGDYNVAIDTGRSDEIGKLAQSFDVLMRDLREKRDMQNYMANLSRSLPSGAVPGNAGSLDKAAVTRVALLTVELRGYAGTRLSQDPEHTLERLGRDLRRISTAVTSRRGQVESVFGHRVLASFEGDGRTYRALAAAAEASASLQQKENDADIAEAPVLAISVGDAVTGAVVAEESPLRAVVGMPVQQLEALLREAAPGDILLSKDAFEELKEPFRDAGVELVPQRALLSSQPLYVLRSDLAARVTGLEVAWLASPGLAGGDSPATLSGIAPGSLLGDRFQILSVLGAGGMGVVYKARDRELDDLVALKMLKKEMATDAVLLERLKSELKLARKITHPNVLRTFDFGEVNGLPYISMEYVRGVTLRYLLDREGRLPYSAALRLAKQLCAGLGAAHAQGVIHRDIKPENLIIDQGGNAKLMDFGIARPEKRVAPGQTQAGWIVGTPQYLSPEQLEGKEADGRADIYACGVVFYEMFSGELPFTGDNPMKIIMAHLNEAPARPSAYWREIPPALENLIMRCLEKDRDQRYKTVADLQQDLETLSA